MPYADREQARKYFREYRRLRRGGDTCSTPVHPACSAEFRLEVAGDVIALLENQIQEVLEADDVGTLEKARCLGYLAAISLRAIEFGNLAARLEAVEAVLHSRNGRNHH